MGESSGVRCTIEGRAARVVLDLPPVNIVGADLIIGLFPLLDELEASDISVVVFRSADPDFFLMHGDVTGILDPRGGSEGCRDVAAQDRDPGARQPRLGRRGQAHPGGVGHRRSGGRCRRAGLLWPGGRTGGNKPWICARG